MRLLYPHLSASVRSAVLTVRGEFSPTGRSRAYRVQIEYEVGEPPRVWVVSPKLELREENGRIPHMYGQERLCLFLPGVGEWGSEMSLAHTVIPWVADWLFYYEVWKVTGEWLGGGVEPEPKLPVSRAECKEVPYERDRN